MKMTKPEELEVDCCEDELSEIQKNFYVDALQEYEKAMSEADQIKKEGSSVTKNGNVWSVKSTYQVKVRNPLNPPVSVSSQQPISVIQPQAINTLKNMPNTFIMAKAPLSSMSQMSPLILTQRVPLTRPAVNQPSPVTMTIDEGAFPASQLLSKFTESTAKKQKSIPSVQQTSQAVQALQIAQAAPTIQSTQGILTNQTLQSSGTLKKPFSNVTVHLHQPVQPSEIAPSSATSVSASISQQSKAPTSSTITTTKKNAQSGSIVEDPKLLSKTIPSLCVVVRPANAVPDAVNQKKRETLDSFVKSRLVLDSRRFAEWLMQVGLLRSQQFGTCRIHSSIAPAPLQLRMYAEEHRFPHSGGYVWITKCCDRNFVSIFRESIFEESSHPPTVLLKLIYHWACQTTVANVVQWVKIDHIFLRMFYTMLRSVCTVEIHSSTPMFGLSPKNNRVEVAVISLGTTSTDGKRRDVKVEVLGILEQETQKIRLRVSEPIVGETRSQFRFAKILEPLSKWLSPKATILTDYTVDRQALEQLGFRNVVQKNFNTALPDDSMNNRNIMGYLRKTIPKVFQNNLSLLSTATIQQFLDELVWREVNGQSSAEAFHNIVRDISAQTRTETGMPLIKRLPLVTMDPFNDWGLNLHKTSPTSSNEATTSTATPSLKRPCPGPVPKDGPSNAKEMRPSSYYSTMFDASKETLTSDPKEPDTFCQHADCQKLVKGNLEMMLHLRQHLVTDVAVVDGGEWNEHCNYCLETLPSVSLKKVHEEGSHTFMSSFKSQKLRGEDSAIVKEVVCLICHERFQQHRQLELHLEKTHVYCEMPYRCRVCHFQTSVHSQLIDHFHQNHQKSSHLLCPLCLDTFSTKGDNLTQGLDAGHMQYLQHLKHHLVVPVANRHRCKRCVLTFQQYEQLRYHVRTDHISAVSNPAARPFTYTVVKAPCAKGSVNHQTVIYTSNILTASVATCSSPSISTELMSSTSGHSITSSVTPSPASSSLTGLKAGLKTYAKDISQEIPNTSVARRFTDVTLTEETLTMAYHCIECEEPLKKKNHFTGYFCCTLCRFSTCCSVKMKKHQNQVHKPKLYKPMLGVVYQLSEVVKCKCGFETSSGIELKRHFARCDLGSVTVAST